MQVFEVEDAFFTGVLAARAGVVKEKVRGIWVKKVVELLATNKAVRMSLFLLNLALLQKDSQPCVNSEGTVISYPTHSGSPVQLIEAWDHLRKLRCRYFLEHFILTFLYDD